MVCSSTVHNRVLRSQLVSGTSLHSHMAILHWLESRTVTDNLAADPANNNWRVRGIESKKKRKGKADPVFPPQSNPPSYWYTPYCEKCLRGARYSDHQCTISAPRGPILLYDCSPLEAMQKYVEWIHFNDPNFPLTFMICAERRDKWGKIHKYPYYKEHASRVMDMISMTRMAVHVDPAEHGATVQ